jgi:hypothetical protein
VISPGITKSFHRRMSVYSSRKITSLYIHVHPSYSTSVTAGETSIELTSSYSHRHKTDAPTLISVSTVISSIS